MLFNYIKVALKVLGRRRFFTFISLFGISLTLVVLMVATAILENVFTPRAPESRFDRVLTIRKVSMRGPHFTTTSEPGYGFIERYVKNLEGAERTAVYSTVSQSVIFDGARRIDAQLRRTDGNYWQILDFEFIEGGPFTEADNQEGRFVAVITDDLKQKLFGAGPAVGRTFETGGQRYSVIGVVPSVPISRMVAFSSIWTPIRTLKGRDYETKMVGSFGAIVLARGRSDFDLIRGDFSQRLSRFAFDDPARYDRVIASLDTPFEAVARGILAGSIEGHEAATLRAILAIVALLFLTLPTMNLVSINLSRIMERSSEIGVRKAFGASSRTLVGQFVVENVVLTLIGGVAGLLLTIAALAVLGRSEVIPHAVFTVNLRVFAWAMVIAAIFGVISGAYPAWRMSRMQAVDALRGGAA
ncbi:MAG TPA: ABC transporter permease [Thermoanaerobaculia bacterium]